MKHATAVGSSCDGSMDHECSLMHYTMPQHIILQLFDSRIVELSNFYQAGQASNSARPGNRATVPKTPSLSFLPSFFSSFLPSFLPPFLPSFLSFLPRSFLRSFLPLLPTTILPTASREGCRWHGVSQRAANASHLTRRHDPTLSFTGGSTSGASSTPASRVGATTRGTRTCGTRRWARALLLFCCCCSIKHAPARRSTPRVLATAGVREPKTTPRFLPTAGVR